MIEIGRKWISSERRQGRHLSFEISRLRQAARSASTQLVNIVLSAFILTACLWGTTGGAQGQSIVKGSAKYSPLHDSLIEAHLIMVEDLRVHYIDAGTGRSVVMIHGNAGNVEDFEFGTIQLLSPNYRVVAGTEVAIGQMEKL